MDGMDTPEWTEGVCGDGAAILRDGVMVPIEDVVARLNHLEDALHHMEKAASKVSNMGARTGPQWSSLTSALLHARCVLTKPT